MNARRTFLIGMPGSGKSTVGRLLANKAGMDFIDLDEEIEVMCKMTVAEIFDQKGEAYFRLKEAEILRQVIVRHPSSVIACGGGTPCFHDNMGLMNMVGFTVYIKATPEEIAERLESEGKDKRPLLKQHNGQELINYLSEKLKNRAPYYEEARLSIPATGSPEEVAEQSTKVFRR